MSMKHKVHGFLTAIILAVVSFFVIYIFCPEFSQRVMGISFRKTAPAVSTTEVIDLSTLLKK